MELLKPPRVEEREERPTLRIRQVTPFRGMLKVRNELLYELDTWLEGKGHEDAGPAFLRLHVVDMAGDMDIEVGVVTVQAGRCKRAGISDPGGSKRGRLRPPAIRCRQRRRDSLPGR